MQWLDLEMAKFKSLIGNFVPVFVALFFGGLVILFTGGNPFKAYFLLFREAFWGADHLKATLMSSTVLLFTSTATAIGFRAGIFTLAAEGSFLAGGLTAAVIGSEVLNVNSYFGIPLILILSMLAGILASFVPSVLKAYLNIDEVVTTLMFNFVIVGIITWLVQRFFLAPTQANSSTRFIRDKYFLSNNFFNLGISTGFILGLLTVLLYSIFFKKSAYGFDFKSLGFGKDFAKLTGVDIRKITFVAMLSTGAFAGLGGGVHLTGLIHRYVPGFSAGYGFTGLAIALLARLKPSGLITGSILFGALYSAGSTVQLFYKIPLDIVNVLQGILMIAAVVQFKSIQFSGSKFKFRKIL
jgi:simple sugar transport system permease protein